MAACALALGCASNAAGDAAWAASFEGRRVAVGVGGMDGATAGLAQALAPTGVRAASVPCAALAWSAASPPDLEAADAAVRALQAAGFADLAICIDLRASGPPQSTRFLGVRSPVPSPEQHDDLARWAASLAERYDGDGEGDMPGLEEPVRLVRLGAALGPGALEPFDDYLALLPRVRRALLGASRDIRLALAPVRARGRPPGALADRLERLFATRGAFDVWSVEASGSVAELDAWLAWLRDRSPSKAVAVLGVGAAPKAEGGAPARCDARGPDRSTLAPELEEADRCALAGAFRALLAKDPDAVAWARAEAARDVVKKAIVAASYGVERVELASPVDATWWTHPSFGAAAGLAAWSGLVEPASGRAYPAFFALEQVARILATRPAVAPAEAEPPDVRVYRLRGAAGPAWVAWYEPALFVGPGEPAPATVARLPVDRASLRGAATIVELGASRAEPAALEVHHGVAWLELTPTPVFLLPD